MDPEPGVNLPRYFWTACGTLALALAAVFIMMRPQSEVPPEDPYPVSLDGAPPGLPPPASIRRGGAGSLPIYGSSRGESGSAAPQGSLRTGNRREGTGETGPPGWESEEYDQQEFDPPIPQPEAGEGPSSGREPGGVEPAGLDRQLGVSGAVGGWGTAAGGSAPSRLPASGAPPPAPRAPASGEGRSSEIAQTGSRGPGLSPKGIGLPASASGGRGPTKAAGPAAGASSKKGPAASTPGSPPIGAEPGASDASGLRQGETSAAAASSSASQPASASGGGAGALGGSSERKGLCVVKNIQPPRHPQACVLVYCQDASVGPCDIPKGQCPVKHGQEFGCAQFAVLPQGDQPRGEAGQELGDGPPPGETPPPAAEKVTVALQVSPTSVSPSRPVDVSWQSTGADWCTDDLGRQLGLSGGPQKWGPYACSVTIAITCGNRSTGAQDSKSAAVTVRSVGGIQCE